jgi:hypothetical protein
MYKILLNISENVANENIKKIKGLIPFSEKDALY